MFKIEKKPESVIDIRPISLENALAIIMACGCKKNKKKENELRRGINKGMKPFKYGNKVVWALNQEIADRKAKSRRYI